MAIYPFRQKLNIRHRRRHPNNLSSVLGSPVRDLDRQLYGENFRY